MSKAMTSSARQETLDDRVHKDRVIAGSSSPRKRSVFARSELLSIAEHHRDPKDELQRFEIDPRERHH